MVMVRLKDLLELLQEDEISTYEYIEIDVTEEDVYEGHVFPPSITVYGNDGYGGATEFGDERLNDLAIPYDYKYAKEN
jgi:hypothetical protein